jgi:ribosome-binding factor A
MTRRIERVEKNLQKIIAQVIDEELQPPEMVSVMNVTCDLGLTAARVAVSVYTKNQEFAPTIEYLEQRKRFIRREVSARAKMRRTPQITFVLDTSLEDGQSMLDMISGLSIRR